MKQLLMCLVVFLVFFETVSYSQESLTANNLTVKAVWFNYHSPNNDNKKLFNDLDNGIELGYTRNLSNLLSLSVPVRFGAARFPIYNESTKDVTSYTRRKIYAGLDALLGLHFYKGKAISPFIYAGIGASAPSFDFDNLHGQAPFGFGLDIKLSDRMGLIAQTDYRFAFKDGYDNWQHALGFRICLCEGDRDKDGYADSKDDCPDDAGTISGCPDRDNDRIRDLDDKCPEEAGVVENYGCPADMDKDGVYDRDDDCPKVAGTIKGCPDKDKDGVADKDDRCPDVAGTIKGCPDTDKDGVVDIDDKCPKVAGPASNFGCPPDKDNDGYPDATDPCPDLAGTINGCPDTDGDGITDNLDKCPNTKGIAALMGCPEIKMEDKKVLDIAMRAVQFQTGTAVITKSSYKNLNDVLVVLNKYPEMNSSIEGHTDSVADDALNQKLSEKRAKACMDYLIKKGINVSRLMSAGYGETKPVGDNKTRDGRQLNRRTEFNPVWR
ncbi:MAG: OmpA family protein [Saprospiraceae bacterium]|nr:OmpA family protein [Saprospiraceae bacterium]